MHRRSLFSYAFFLASLIFCWAPSGFWPSLPLFFPVMLTRTPRWGSLGSVTLHWTRRKGRRFGEEADIGGEDWVLGEQCCPGQQAWDSQVWVVVSGVTWSFLCGSRDTFQQCRPWSHQLSSGYPPCGLFLCISLWSHWKGNLY